VAPSFSGPLHQPGAGITADTDEMFVVLHLLSHGASWRTFEFLGYKVGRGRGLRHKAGGPSLYAIPTDRSIKRFKDKVRTATNRRNPKDLEGVLAELNPIIRGWGNYYRRAKVRRLYHRLNRWIVLRVWNHQHKHWRNAGWRYLPERRLYGELGLVNLLQLIPSMESYYRQKGYAR
jgi:RNA-directed DNA polymerase